MNVPMPTGVKYAEFGQTLERREERTRARLFRRWTGACLAAASLFLTASCSGKPPIPQPRLVVLYATCTLNKDFIAPYDPRVPYTPALGKFSEDAVVFQRHTTEAGVSGIAYASIFSGAHADAHQVYQHPRVLDDELYLISEAFGDAGYDVHYWQGHKMATADLNYVQGVPEENIRKIDELKSVREGLFEGDAHLQRILQRLEEDPDYKALLLVAFTVTHAAYNRQVFPDEVDNFARRHPTLMEASKFDDTEELLAIYEENRLELQWNYPEAVKRLGLTNRQQRRMARILELYYRTDIALLDVLFGRFMHTLREAGVYDDALIAVTADHGELLTRPNALFHWGHGLQLAPEVLNVPLLLHPPKGTIPPGKYESVTRSIDLYPTLAGLCNIELPEKTQIQGQDLTDALLGKKEAPELLGLSHTKVLNQPLMELFEGWGHVKRYYPRSDPQLIWVAARRGDTFHKIRHVGDGHWAREVYDLATDMGETKNRYDPADPDQAQVFEYLESYKLRLVNSYTEQHLDPEKVEESLRGLGYIR